MIEKRFDLKTICVKYLVITIVFIVLADCFFMQPARAEVIFANTCVFGRSEAPLNVQITNEDINNFIEVSQDPGGTIAEDPQAAKELYDFINGLWENFRYLRIEGPSHVLQNESARFKGNMFDPYAYINFYNSEDGYVGKDKSNLEANAYKRMTFKGTYGYALAWITRGSRCSAKGVWVQKAPTISKKSLTGGNNITASVNFGMDKYSKYFQNNINAAVRFYWINEAGLSGVKTIRPSGKTGTATATIFGTGGGPIRVRASIFDGNFSRTVDLGDVVVEGPIETPCRDCEIF